MITTKVCWCSKCRSKIKVRSHAYTPYYKCPNCGKKNIVIVSKEKV